LFPFLLFLVTANIGNPLLNFYESLFSIPGFSMFRSFYTKFSFPFVFFFAILLSLSLFYLSKLLKKKIFILYIFLFLVIVFNGWPLISGIITNGVLWQSKDVKIPIEIEDTYLSFINYLKNKKVDLVLEHKAERYHLVAAASIIAKVVGDSEIEKIKKKIGIDFGSGYMSDQKTAEFLKKHYETHSGIFRKSWAPYKDIMGKKSQKNLSEFSSFLKEEKRFEK